MAKILDLNDIQQYLSDKQQKYKFGEMSSNEIIQNSILKFSKVKNEDTIFTIYYSQYNSHEIYVEMQKKFRDKITKLIKVTLVIPSDYGFTGESDNLVNSFYQDLLLTEKRLYEEAKD